MISIWKNELPPENERGFYHIRWKTTGTEDIAKWDGVFFTKCTSFGLERVEVGPKVLAILTSSVHPYGEAPAELTPGFYHVRWLAGCVPDIVRFDGTSFRKCGGSWDRRFLEVGPRVLSAMQTLKAD